MKKVFLIFLSVCFIFTLTACKNKTNLTEISKNLSSYEIELNLDATKKEVCATQTIKYINNTNSVLKHVKFHLYPQFFEKGATEHIVPNTKMNIAYPNGVSYAEFNINRVKVENQEKPIIYEEVFDSILTVELNSSLMPQEETNIYLEYSFVLPNCEHRFGYGDNTINIANFYPIICVFEDGKFNTNGYHSNGDPFYSNIANYSVTITIDKQYVVTGTGNKILEKTTNENKIATFKANAVRDFALVASEKFNVVSAQVEDTVVDYFFFNDNNSNKSLTAGVDAIKTFSKLFGNYPYEHFSIVQCDFVYGGMEYPNLIMISENIENFDDYLNVIIHETAHQWWYAIVGNDEYSNPWLDEALTEFSTILFYDYNKNYNFNHAKMIEASRENYSLFITVYEDVLGHIDTSMRAVNEYSTEPEYTYCTYVKGVLMYESLYQLIGKENFIKSLKLYYEENKFSNAAPNDLIQAFEKTTNKNLQGFFSSWLAGKVVIK